MNPLTDRNSRSTDHKGFIWCKAVSCHGLQTAAQIALGLCTAYNIAATVVSFPAGEVSDRLGKRGPLLVTAAGVATFLVPYVLFALFHTNMTPYGTVQLRPDRRLDLTGTPPAPES